MATSSKSLNRHDDDHDDSNLRRVTRATHAATAIKGKGTISASTETICVSAITEGHQDEYEDELELNRELNEGYYDVDEIDRDVIDREGISREVRNVHDKFDALSHDVQERVGALSRDVQEQVGAMTTKFDALLTTLNLHANKAGPTEEIMDRLHGRRPSNNLPDRLSRRPSISLPDRPDRPDRSGSDRRTAEIERADDTQSISSGASFKISDLSRELMKLIPRYDRSGGAAKLFEYIDQFDEFALTTEYTSLIELKLAIAKLNDDAKIWWRSHRNTFPDDHSQRINCWSQLKRALIDHFTPPEHSYNIRVKLSNLKQSGSVADYNASFMRLRQQLTKISDDDVIYEYLRGLNPKIRETVRAQKDNQADLRTLQNACLRVDTTRSTSDRSTEEAHVTSVANRGGVRDQNGCRGGAHRGRGTHRQATYSRSSDSTRHPYKKNTSDKTDGPQSKSCYLCDSKDHFAGKCPDIPKIREMLISHPDQSASLAIGATIIDSGATQHMFYQLDDLSDVTQNKTTITCANSQTLRSTHMGSINLTDELNLENVLCVPDLQHNLISVRALNKSSTDVIFKSDGTVNISDDDNNNSKQIGHAIGDLFHLSTRQEEEAYLAEHSSRRTFDEYTLWHHRLGHPGRKVMRSMTQYALGLGNVQLADPINDICAGCARAKSHRQPFGSASNRSSDILGRVHTDLCGPMQMQSISGARYLLTFIDDATRYVTVYSIANKSDTFNQFVDHLTLVENQSGKSLKILRSDGGGEYINSEMRNYLAEKGIRHETTVAETPQQNGVAERYNRMILELIRAIKLSANVPDELWAELAITAAYLRNRLPMRANYNRGNISPYEAWHGNQPSIDHLRVIWADAYAHITKSKRRKLDSRSKKLKLIGYQDDKKAYRLWDQERDKVEISRDVIFDESIILNSQSTLSNIADDEYVIEAIIGEREKDDEKKYLVKWLGYDDDTWEPITHVIDTEALIEWNDRSKQHALLINCISDISIDDDPATYQEALLRPDASLWRQAIESELKSLNDNDTWSIIPHQLFPDGCQPIRYK